MSAARRPGGARRAADRPVVGPRLLRKPSITAVLGLLLVASSVGAALSVSHSDAGAVRPLTTYEPVSSAALVCPAYGSGVATTYVAGRADVGETATDGAVTTGPVTASTPLALTPGVPTGIAAAADAGVLLHATGAQARGLFAWRTDGPDLAPCPQPRADWWFADAGGGLDHASVLVLTNPDPGPATVDLRALGTDGEVDVTIGGHNLQVAPGATVLVRLDQLAPGSDDLALGVHATRGRVVAALADGLVNGKLHGFDWMPAQSAPGADLEVAGVAGAAQTRILYVANPSSSQAVVTVEVAGPSGRVVPADLKQQSIKPGDLVAVDLASVLPGQSYAVRVVASQPVVAGVRTTLADGGLVHAGAVDPLVKGERGLVPIAAGAAVQLTAGAAPAIATLAFVDAAGHVVSSTPISLSPYTTVATPAPTSSYAVVTTGSGSVAGAAVTAAASVPLLELPVTVAVPQVRPAG